jgi:hypothetical protein
MSRKWGENGVFLSTFRLQQIDYQNFSKNNTNNYPSREFYKNQIQKILKSLNPDLPNWVVFEKFSRNILLVINALALFTTYCKKWEISFARRSFFSEGGATACWDRIMGMLLG